MTAISSTQHVVHTDSDSQAERRASGPFAAHAELAGLATVGVGVAAGTLIGAILKTAHGGLSGVAAGAFVGAGAGILAGPGLIGAFQRDQLNLTPLTALLGGAAGTIAGGFVGHRSPRWLIAGAIAGTITGAIGGVIGLATDPGRR